ncbi:metallophosphoesterase [Flavihumibacter sp. R14]|nr:metallophosphoesterase [Flavihumibacter soli]
MKKVSRRKFIIDLFTLTTITLVADAVWLEKFFIETNEFFLGDASSNTENLKIVQISDLHLRSIDMQHRMLAKKINKLKPDLILFTGDSVDRLKTMDLFDEYLGHFDQGIKKVAILGNREYKRGVSLEKLRDIYLRHNTDLLVNDSKIYSVGKDKISITGIDDFREGKPDFPKAMTKYTPADHHIVLTHCPEHRDTILKEMGNTPIDFILSGHTHGGQVRILGYAPYKPEGSGRYLSGWYREELPHLYVSKGIGTTAIPIRFGSRAEIAIFHLKTKALS